MEWLTIIEDVMKKIKIGPHLLVRGDCLEVMARFPERRISTIICDLPYGTTACAWDSVIDFEELWKQYKRIRTDSVVLFGAQPFTTSLIASNLKNYRYSWVWKKNFSTNFLHAKRMPLRNTEDIAVFYKGKYHPQKTRGHKPTQSARGASNGVLYHGINVRNSPGGSTERYPTTILEFDAQSVKKRLHPSQKPLDLLRYLLKTYSDKGDRVLDNTMGSGTAGEACILEGRVFVGIEKDKAIFDVACDRINEAYKESRRA